MGDSDHPIAGSLECGIADPVILEGAARAVVGMPVDFDDQSAVVPHDVGLVAADQDVDLGPG